MESIPNEYLNHGALPIILLTSMVLRYILFVILFAVFSSVALTRVFTDFPATKKNI